MYHQIDVARREVKGYLFVCIQLYSYNGEYLDCVLSEKSDLGAIVLYIDEMIERHKISNVRIATDAREVIQYYIPFPGHLALYATPGELSRAYRLLREDSEYLQLAMEFTEPVEVVEEQPVSSEKLTLLQRIYRRFYVWLSNLLRRMNIDNKSEERSRS